MSKKNTFTTTSLPASVSSHTAEYHVIKHDLYRLIILNLIYLTVLMAVYFSNQKNHYIDQWFARVLHF